MKKTILLMSGVLLIAFSAFIGGCVKEDFNEPLLIMPTVDFKSNWSIAKLKSSYSGTLDTIDGDTIIQGIVVANDKSGNLYKRMVIQDETGGIEIGLDMYDIHNVYRVGQRVFIKCKGICIGDYHELIQLGYNNGGEIGRLPEILTSNHIYKDSFPGTPPTPRLISIGGNNFDYLSTLVKLENVYFPDSGEVFANQLYDATEHDIKDAQGKSLIVRTSKYADFASQLIPGGTGTVVGILSIYDSEFQLTIRSIEDVIGFNDSTPPPPPPVGEFSYPVGSPSTIDSLIENFDDVVSNEDITFTGWTNLAAAGTRNWQGKIFNTDKYAQATSYQTSDASNIPWLITPPIAYNTQLKLSFQSAMAYYKHDGLSVWLLHSWTGDPETATWVEIPATLAGSGNANYEWVPSDEIPLSTYVPTGYTGNIYIGFKYKGDENNSTSYCIDAVNVRKGGSVGPIVVTSVHENFDMAVNYTDIQIEGWTNAAVEGSRKWQGKTYNTDKYTQATAYNSLDNTNVTYLITPEVQYAAGMILNFKSAMAYYKHDGLTVLISTDFNGSNISGATWTTIPATLAGSANPNYEWVPSGDISLAPYLPSGYTGTFFIAFKYAGDKTNNTTSYCVDEINIQ
ncbi:MAG: DUF5017 domain-containing protein [Bacteroidetes bacterium]|nr:DUF5017 domain-containing protein [Bacteroidota bacterium]